MIFHAFLSLTPILAAQSDVVEALDFTPRATTLAADEVVIPIDLATGHAIVDVTIDGLGPFPMLFDTGASATTLDRSLSEELGLPVVGETTGGDPSDPDALRIELVIMPTLTLGGLQLDEILAGSWGRPAALGGGATRGILGLPTFEDCLVTIDYAKSELRVTRGALAPPEEDPNVVPLLREPSGLIGTPLRLPSGREVNAHLDTGNQNSIFVPIEFESELPLVEGSVREVRGQRASGPVILTSGQLEGDLTIGPLVLRNPDVRLDRELKHANLGLDFFRSAAVTIDLANERMRIVPYSAEREHPHRFDRTHGTPNVDRGVHVTPTRDGGYAAVGYTVSSGEGGEDIYLVRTSAAGDVLWTKTYGGADDELGWYVHEAADGFLLAGSTRSSGAGGFDFYLVKTDEQGEHVWSKTYGGGADDRCWALAATGDGGYVLVGETASSGAGERDGFVVKTDARGTELWTRTFGGERDDRLFSVATGDDGGLVLAGQTFSEGEGDRDAFVLATDSNGELRWSHTFGGPESDVAHSVTRTSAGDFFVTGYTTSFATEGDDPYLILLDAEGDVIWESVLPLPGIAHTITGGESARGGFFCVGFQATPGAPQRALLVKTDKEGQLEWHRTFFDGASEESMGYTVRATPDGDCVFTGHAPGAGGADLWIVEAGDER